MYRNRDKNLDLDRRLKYNDRKGINEKLRSSK